MAVSATPIKLGYSAVVTFEFDKGEPEVWRSGSLPLVDSEPDQAARRAVFRALIGQTRTAWHSVVIVLTREGQ